MYIPKTISNNYSHAKPKSTHSQIIILLLHARDMYILLVGCVDVVFESRDSPFVFIVWVWIIMRTNSFTPLAALETSNKKCENRWNKTNVARIKNNVYKYTNYLIPYTKSIFKRTNGKMSAGVCVCIA